MNSLDKWLPNCSPYITKFVYDIDKRELVIEFALDSKEFKPHTRIVCSSINKYSESNMDDETHDDCMDGVLDLEWIEESCTFLVTTDKKEILLSLDNIPIREIIT